MSTKSAPKKTGSAKKTATTTTTKKSTDLEVSKQAGNSKLDVDAILATITLDNLDNINLDELKAQASSPEVNEQVFAELNALFLECSNQIKVIEARRRKVIELLQSYYSTNKKPEGGDNDSEAELENDLLDRDDGDDDEPKVPVKLSVKKTGKQTKIVKDEPLSEDDSSDGDSDGDDENNSESDDEEEKPVVKKVPPKPAAKKTAGAAKKTAGAAKKAPAVKKK